MSCGSDSLTLNVYVIHYHGVRAPSINARRKDDGMALTVRYGRTVAKILNGSTHLTIVPDSLLGMQDICSIERRRYWDSDVVRDFVRLPRFIAAVSAW